MKKKKKKLDKNKFKYIKKIYNTKIKQIYKNIF